MPNKRNKTKSYTLYMISAPIVVLAAIVMFGSFLLSQGVSGVLQDQGSVLPSKTSNNGKGNNSAGNQGKGQANPTTLNTNNGNSNSGKPTKPNNKPVISQKGQNAPEYKENMKKVAKELRTVSLLEEQVGNDEVSDEIEEVAVEENEEADDAAEAIGKVESRNRFQTLLMGSDYKNLGELRSQLVRNRNSIRKLVKNANGTVANGSGESVEEQLQTMYQERERIKAVIEENESDFSLFGWVSRFLTGYEMTPIGGAEEEELLDEVEDIIGDVTEPSNELDVDDSTEPSDGLDVEI